MAKRKSKFINKKPKTILVVANCCWYIFNFRKEFINKLEKEGYKIILLASSDEYYSRVKEYFVKVENLFLVRGSINPVYELFTILNILYIITKHKPLLVHNFTIKPCLYSSLISRLIGIKNVINHITGLGPSFYTERIRIKFINILFSPVYKYIFNSPEIINIFHNYEDRDTFINKNLTTKNNTYVVQGSGVDIGLFKKKKFINKFQKIPIMLFPARIIKEKGIIELINACNELWSENYNFYLFIAGEIDKQNKSCLDKKTFQDICRNNKVKFLGKSDNMLDIYKNTDFVVLPSWREGLSKSILEAASMELPIITTNVPGCKDIIENNFSGILVPPKDKNSLKNAIRFYLNNQTKAIQYGLNARLTVEENFSLIKINNQLLNIYDHLLVK